jgi:hypothetical protein
MTATAAPDVRRPRTDERRLWEIMFGVFGGQAFLPAFQPPIWYIPLNFNQIASYRTSGA